MKARALGEPVCVAGRRPGTSAVRMRFEVDRDVAERVVLIYRPGSCAKASEGTPARVWGDNHVVAGLEVPLTQLSENQRLTLELWTAEEGHDPLWQREAVIERLDEEQGLHHMSLLP